MAYMEAKEWAVFFLHLAIGCLWAEDYSAAVHNLGQALKWLERV